MYPGIYQPGSTSGGDDETFRYNNHITRGFSKERLARVLNVHLSPINRRTNLLEGICPEVIAMLHDKQFNPHLTRILRNIKAAR